MSTFKKDFVLNILSCPAYNAVIREPKSDGSINLTHGEIVLINKKKFHVFGLFGSSIEYNSDPIPSYERTLRNGHPIAALSGAGTLVAGGQEKYTVVSLHPNDLVYIEGHCYRLVEESNQNYDLVEVTEMKDHKFVRPAYNLEEAFT